MVRGEGKSRFGLMLEKFRDRELSLAVAEKIKRCMPERKVKFCHVCGTHEWTITHYGLRSLLPKNLEVIAGPGCPVCIVPSSEIDAAIELALEGVVITTFGDVINVPGSELSLRQARSMGGDVREVYSVRDAVEMAKKEPDKEFVFFAIGFETTAPSTAIEVLRSEAKNLRFLISHRLIPPAMELLLGLGELEIDGFIAPGHVSSIIGLKPYKIFPEAYRMPTVIAGFEPLDVLFSLYMLLRQVRNGEAKLENEYTRSVTWDGNVKAQKLISRVFDVVSGRWRGLGVIPRSTLSLKKEYEHLDARKFYKVKLGKSRDIYPGCCCHLIMVGKLKPTDCPLFMEDCTPQTPKGPCMVSIEGTCGIWARHGVRLYR